MRIRTVTPGKIILGAGLLFLAAQFAAFSADPPAPGDPLNDSPVGASGERAALFQANTRNAFLQLGGDFVILDISDPGRIREQARLALRAGARIISIPDQYAFESIQAEGGTATQILDTRNPWRLKTVGGIAFKGAPEAMVFSREAGAAAVREPGAKEASLQWIDVLNPLKPVSHGEIKIGAEGKLFLRIDRTLLYALDQASGMLRVIDFSPAGSPRMLGEVQIMPNARSFEMTGTRGYALDAEGKVQVVELVDPKRPRVRGEVQIHGGKLALRKSGVRLFIPNGPGGELQIVDVGNPDVPRLQGVFSAPGTDLNDVAIYRSLVYIAAGDRGLLVVDVSNPSDPVLRDEIDLGGPVTGIMEAGSLALASGPHIGLRIVEMSKPGALSIKGSYPLNERASKN